MRLAVQVANLILQRNPKKTHFLQRGAVEAKPKLLEHASPANYQVLQCGAI